MLRRRCHRRLRRQVHPIMASLEGTPQAWMSTMLTAFNAGDVAAYRATAAASECGASPPAGSF
jgi:hypothetical protein|eukprot:COSAG01_NODE_4181_length_5263_cov_38.640008_4_plen_63_part_00